MTPRLEALEIRNFRSTASNWVKLQMPATGPLVLLGENNAGKSNLIRGLDLLFGERWPASFQPEQHDFFERHSDGVEIGFRARVSGIACGYCGADLVGFKLLYHDSGTGNPCTYSIVCSSCTKTYANKAMRESIFAMTISADRRLSYQLSYSSQYTYLSRLMRRFHDRLTYTPERIETLKSIFATLTTEFEGLAEFRAFRSLLKGFTDDFSGNMQYALEVDFSAYDPSNYFRSLRIHPAMRGEVRSFDELGTGQEQVLALAFTFAYAQAFPDTESLILVIDEPEAHLHPIAQQWLAQRLQQLSAAPLQAVITTHSPAFVDLAKPENLVVVRKGWAQEAGTVVKQVSRPQLVSELQKLGAVMATVESVGEFYKSNSTIEIANGFFSRGVVLVEGPTEVLALPELMRKAGLDLVREGISVVAVHGVSGIGKWLRLFSVFDVPVFAIFDSDSDKTGKEASERLRDREDAMIAMGLQKDDAAKPDSPLDGITIEVRYARMEPDFEGSMSFIFGDRWTEAYVKAAGIVGTSKPLRARYASRTLLVRDSDSPLRSLADAIRTGLGLRINETEQLTSSDLAASEHDDDPPPF